MALNYKVCPNCRSKKSVEIIYGEPTPEIYEKAQKGKVKLGGCCINEESPEYYCTDCNHQWNKQQIINEEYRKILSIKAYVGGYFGPSYEVEVDLRNSRVFWNSLGEENAAIPSKAINRQEKDQIVEGLKKLKLFNWKEKYINSFVCDGTQWSVDIQTSEGVIHKYGNNKYPTSWKAFCRLMEDITGKEFR